MYWWEDYSTASIWAKMSDTESEFWQMCTSVTRTIERGRLCQHPSIQPSGNSFSFIRREERLTFFVDIRFCALFSGSIHGRRSPVPESLAVNWRGLQQSATEEDHEQLMGLGGKPMTIWSTEVV